MQLKRYSGILMILSLAIGIFIMSMAPTTALATFSLKLDDGLGNVVIVNDGGIGDSNIGTGQITFVGSVGPNWTINITTGRSKPNVGSATSPALRLDTTNTSSIGAGVLTMLVSDQDFGPSINPLPVVITSNSSDPGTGQVATTAYLDLANVLFAQTTPFAPAVIGTGLYNVATTGSAPSDSQFSLTMKTVLTHGSAKTSQFDSSLDTVPEPTTLLLLGFGLVGVAGYAWRRNRKQS